MYSIHAARHCHSFTLLRRSLIISRTPILQHASLKTLARPQSKVQQCLPALRRSVSTQSPTSAAAKAQLGRMIASLDFLNVYQAGPARTVFVGMCRMVTIVVFGLGVFVVAPRMYFDPDTSMWWVPGVVVGAAVPLVMLSFLSAPFVSAVRVLLPGSAKRSHDALMKFAENVPQDTKVLFQTMRWLPWPTHKEVFFSDLRRLTGRRISANLEHVPLGHEKAHKASQIMGGRLASRMYEKYWVDMSARNKSRAPGVWERMWDQITIKGQEPLKVAPKDRLPPAMANRPAPSEAAGRKLPPPPPPVKPKKGARSKKSR